MTRTDTDVQVERGAAEVAGDDGAGFDDDGLAEVLDGAGVLLGSDCVTEAGPVAGAVAVVPPVPGVPDEVQAASAATSSAAPTSSAALPPAVMSTPRRDRSTVDPEVGRVRQAR